MPRDRDYSDEQSTASACPKLNFFVTLGLFAAFTIGLNIGLHGSISLNLDGVKSSGIPLTEPKLSSAQGNAAQEYTVGIDITTPPHQKMPISYDSSTSMSVSTTLDQNPIKVDKIIEKNAGEDLTGNKQIPILLLTCNRAELLDNTLKSLLLVRGVSKDNIVVSQDGAMKQIKDVVDNHGLPLIQNQEGLRLRGGAGRDGASRIARHYKFSLTAIFDRLPDAPAVIIIEDDLLFSPDFYEYFNAVAPILAEDPTTFVVSAWNDNGFKSKIRDPLALRRTEFFPGLGWLLPRQLYKSELESKWPNEHWDHWLRSPNIHKNREIVYPQVPRTYHNGIKGTFMNLDTHNKYFRDIGYNTDPNIAWSSSHDPCTAVVQGTYESRVAGLIQQCKHLKTVKELLDMRDEVVCVWINSDPNPDRKPQEFRPISEFFGIWHEHKRGAHRGLHEFYFESNYILLLNTFRKGVHADYGSLMPEGGGFIRGHREFDPRLLRERNAVIAHM